MLFYGVTPKTAQLRKVTERRQNQWNCTAKNHPKSVAIRMTHRNVLVPIAAICSKGLPAQSFVPTDVSMTLTLSGGVKGCGKGGLTLKTASSVMLRWSRPMVALKLSCTAQMLVSRKRTGGEKISFTFHNVGSWRQHCFLSWRNILHKRTLRKIKYRVYLICEWPHPHSPKLGIP